MKYNLYKALKSAVKEDDVAHIYKMAIQSNPINSQLAFVLQHEKVKVDGWLKLKDFIMLLEFKYDKKFMNRNCIIEVMIQILYYLKRLEEFGEDLPDVCFVGDIDECFCFHSNIIIKYLSEDIDWSIAPSTASKHNATLFKNMLEDNNINPFIREVDETFNIQYIIQEALDLSKEIIQDRRITEKNINRLFNYFINRVLRGKKITKKNPNELVNIFLTCIINPDENYLHPTKKNTLVTKSFGNITVNGNTFKSFFIHYQRDYSPKEKDILTGICDRLIEDTTRRFQGEFFTPTEWVDEAHRMITAEFGEDWKEKYVVYDPACGTANLTRDYKFKELYLSTLNKSDISIIEQRGYNPDAIKFQFDFLNDSDDKLPPELIKALEEGKPIIIFINPPYGAAGKMSLKKGKHKAGVSKNLIGSIMNNRKLDKCAYQLYAQFLYKLILLNENKKFNINLCLFSPTLFLTGHSFKKFRKDFYKYFWFKTGMLFNAKHFSEVADGWGISFSLWKSGITNIEKFPYIVKDFDDKNKIINICSKSIYCIDNYLSGNDWFKTPIKHIKNKEDAPQFKSALKQKSNTVNKVLKLKNSIGYMDSKTNSVYFNQIRVGLYSNPFSDTCGASILFENFNEAIALFVARKSIIKNWINDKDEYLAPNTEHLDYPQWNRDCIIYSLFNNSSNQSSLRNITYKEKKWDIINEWFWLSKETMMNLAEQYHNDELYRDCKNFPNERFVYNKLQEIDISLQAKEILEHATQLIIKTFEFRNILNEEHPEFHLNTWDAGWYQIKLILKQFFPNDLKKFRGHYKMFENIMREGVYKFKFLK